MARPEKSSLEHRQSVNKWTALIVPIFMISAVGYGTWVVIVLISAHYLLHPSIETTTPPRPGAAIAIIVLYTLLLLPMATAYLRTLTLARGDPGFVPTGPSSLHYQQTFVSDPRPEVAAPLCTKRTSPPHLANDKSPAPQESAQGPGYTISLLDIDGIFRGDVPPPSGLSAFYSRDVFQCDPNGLPIWCATCRNWKPDRVHHCSDVGRCVYKLDHFCPWVGGVVGETNFKFFVQFNFFGALYNAFVVIVVGFAVGDIKSRGRSVPVEWIVALALGAMFFLFSGGMVGKCAQDVLLGYTTVDAIDHQKRSVYLAVKVRGREGRVEVPKGTRVPWQGTIAYPFYTKGETQQGAQRETFAILSTPAGMNPWSLGKWGNWKTVMGDRVLDWFLPLRRSPCSDHGRGDSMYPMGPGYQRLLEDAGIAETAEDRRRRRRRSRRNSEREGSLRPSTRRHSSHG